MESFTPPIRIHRAGVRGEQRYLPHASSPRPPSSGMAISSPELSPPPPLPPPRYIQHLVNGQDPGWHWANKLNGRHEHRDHDYKGSVKEELGAEATSTAKEDEKSRHGGEGRIARRGSSETPDESMGLDTEQWQEDVKHLKDQGAKPSRPSIASKRLQSEGHLEQRSRQRSSLAYDKHLVSRIGRPSTTSRKSSFSVTSSNGKDDGLRLEIASEAIDGQIRPLSMPERRASIDSAVARWSSVPSSGTASPGVSRFLSPTSEDVTKSPLGRLASVSAAGQLLEPSLAISPQRGRSELNVFGSLPMEDSGLRNLKITDHSPLDDNFPSSQRAGQKRPASEALREDVQYANNANSESRSAQFSANRLSPLSRFHNNICGSTSSTSSLGPANASSYPSSYGLSVASSLTSYSSGGPSGPFSPAPEAFRSEVADESLTASPLADSRPFQIQKTSNDVLSHHRQSSSSKMQTHYICECCPKKPKKFDTQEELRLHEMEKQYTCQYCQNRFKNKNEAERHQNSLHVRRHSWSCAALQTMEAAFHTSQTEANVDVCGYCGQTFPNQPPNWDVRLHHLNHVHKFGECNQGKKFFRADHFRQHLKHSHGGTSGKWTNMLENACMRDEDPTGMPQVAASQGMPSQAQMANQAQMLNQPQMMNQAQMAASQAQMMAPQAPMMASQAQMAQSPPMGHHAQIYQSQMMMSPQAQQRMHYAGMGAPPMGVGTRGVVIHEDVIDDRLRDL